jgi:CRP-like cAMP-binding protein
MQQRSSISTKNRMLSRLSDDDKALLKPDLETVELTVRQVLEQPDKPITHTYFIEYGLASIVAANGHKRLEVGLIGCEGMTGLPIVLGNDRSPHETFMQVPGNGQRIAADKLREAISQSRSLERALLGFAHSFLNQTANTALSNRTATLEERLARWLLMERRRGSSHSRISVADARGAVCRGYRRPSLSRAKSAHRPFATADYHRSKGTEGSSQRHVS